MPNRSVLPHSAIGNRQSAISIPFHPSFPTFSKTRLSFLFCKISGCADLGDLLDRLRHIRHDWRLIRACHAATYLLRVCFHRP